MKYHSHISCVTNVLLTLKVKKILGAIHITNTTMNSFYDMTSLCFEDRVCRIF